MQHFRVEVIAKTPNPQQVIWAAMHQDYSEKFVYDERDRTPDEAKAGEYIIKHLLMGERGHYGPLEHPQITLNVGFFPHSMMQQLRTHRVGVSFDVQCLAGDTEVTFVKASGALQKIKISELYELWANGEKAVRERKIRGRNGEPPGQYRRDCKTRLKKMHLRVLNEETGIFETGHIQDIFNQGIQPVYRLTLEDGRTLDCTENHRLLTEQGWQTMKDALSLTVDSQGQVISHQSECHLMTNGVVIGEGLYRDKTWLQSQLSAGLTARKIAEEGGFSGEDILPQKLKAHPMKVVQVRYLGLQQTYDLEVAGKWHNFVGNGVVVHNSFRYTGQRIANVIDGKIDLEEVFYLRPVGHYTNRQGKRYFYSEEQRQQDLNWCLEACKLYKQRIEEGVSEEHARSLIPFDARQHFVLSCNVRSLMHILDLRWKKDAQLEIQKFCDLTWEHFQAWVPDIAQWYLENRAKKAKLAP